MQHIEIMLSDGIIGNKATLLALSFLSTGNLNAKLKQGVQPFTMKDVLPSTHEYIIPPLSDEEMIAQKNRQLMGFMASSPKAPKSFLEKMQ